MTTAGEALSELLGTDQWVLRGEPSSESEFKAMFRKITGEDSNGIAVESDDSSTWGVTWSQVTAKKTALDNAEPMKKLRTERNLRIIETDFYALADVTMSDEMKAYRQALRDITTQSPSLDADGNLTGINWPTKP